MYNFNKMTSLKFCSNCCYFKIYQQLFYKFIELQCSNYYFQGATQDPSDNNVMHLSDSITLSVRNQPPKTNSPKKSDAKAVANILATRGITVTATPKPKEKTENVNKESSIPPSVAINLNSAVSIIPAAKNGNTKV